MVTGEATTKSLSGLKAATLDKTLFPDFGPRYADRRFTESNQCSRLTPLEAESLASGLALVPIAEFE
jgi:hypothetical protein